jgi:hypothetical protein
VKSALLTSCSSSWAFGFRHERCASTFPSGRPANHVETSAGQRSSEPRQGDPRLRFLRGCHGDVSFALRLRGRPPHGSRRLLHFNVTAHSTAAWTLQQLRDAIGFEDGYLYLIHDRDSIFATSLDESIKQLGLAVLKSPPRSPMANSICERLIGTSRRECLDWLIPISETHLRWMLKEWGSHSGIATSAR